MKTSPFLDLPPIERKAILLCLCICTISLLLPRLRAYILPWQPQKAELATYKQDYENFLQELAQLEEEEAERLAALYEPENWELRAFDPNRVSEAELESMKLPPPFIRRIMRYQEQGWELRHKDALKKWKQLGNKGFAALRPYLLLPDTQQKASKRTKNTAQFASYTKQETKNKRLYNFNPNTIALEELQELDLPYKLLQRIENYRKRDWNIHSKKQIASWKECDSNCFERIEAFLELPDSTAHKTKATFEKKIPQIIDINASVAADWQSLPGIGPSWARRILKYRDKLGGFSSLKQVSEVYYLPDSLFQAIKPYLQKEQALLRCWNINELSVEELAEHPYIRFFEAKALVEYREREGPYTTVETIRILSAFDSYHSRLEDLLPHLCI